MAISPNVDFVAGAILTATQQNQFPRGVMAFGTRTANTGGLTAGTTTISIPAITFTAVADRYYRISYYEPQYVFGAGHTQTDAAIRQGTLASDPLISLGSFGGSTTVRNYSNVQVVKTFTAGSVSVVATLSPAGGTVNGTAGATFPAFLLVEDIGPA